MPSIAPVPIPYAHLAAVLVGVLVLVVAAPAAAAPPELAFEEQAVVASGLTPGGEAVLFGLAVRAMGYYNRIERHEEVVLVDGTGAARLELAEELAPRAVWAAIDLASGEMTTSASPGFPRQAQPFPTAGLRGQGAVLQRLGHTLESAHVLYARPGEGGGAWGFALDDGGGHDLDGADDGAFELALEQLHPVGGSPPEPPAEMLAGDVLVVVDPTELSLFTLRVVPDPLP